MAVRNANPNMSGLTPFKKGESGNPRGMTKEVRARIASNAEKASRLQELLLDGILQVVENMTPEDREKALRADVNKIILDAMDREFGKAGQQLDLLSSDGSQGPTTVRLIAATSASDDDS